MPGLCSQVLRNPTCQRHANQPLTVWAIRKTDGSAGHSFSPCPTIWSSNIASSDPSHSRPLALWNLLLFSHYSPTSTPRDPHKENRWLGTSINPSLSYFISRPSPPHLFLILRFFFFFSFKARSAPEDFHLPAPKSATHPHPPGTHSLRVGDGNHLSSVAIRIRCNHYCGRHCCALEAN